MRADRVPAERALVDLDLGQQQPEHPDGLLGDLRARCSHPGAERRSRRRCRPVRERSRRRRVRHRGSRRPRTSPGCRTGWRRAAPRHDRRRTPAVRSPASRTGEGRSPSRGRTRSSSRRTGSPSPHPATTRIEARFVPKNPEAPFFITTTSSSRGSRRGSISTHGPPSSRSPQRRHLLQPEPAVPPAGSRSRSS